MIVMVLSMLQCSTQRIIKFIKLINVKKTSIIGILTYINVINISRGREFDPGPVPYFRGD